MAIREVLLVNTFEQQRQLINLIGTDVGDCQNMPTPSKVVVSGINQIIAGAVTLSGQTIQLRDGTSNLPTLSFDTAVDLGIYKHGSTTLGISKSLQVGGDLTVNGNITFRAGNGTGGTLTIGDLSTDTIVFNAQLNSDLIPYSNGNFNLGGASLRWNNLYASGSSFLNTLDVSGAATISGNTTIKNGILATISSSASVFNDTATTINAFGGATVLNIGANTGTLVIGNPTVRGTQSTQYLYNTIATTVNAFGTATQITVGPATGSGIFNLKTLDAYFDGKVHVDGGEILSNLNNFNLLTNNSGVNIGSSIGTGTTTINNSLRVKGSFAANLPASVTPSNNLDMVFQLTNDTTLVIKVKGSDGTVRTATIYLDALNNNLIGYGS